MYKQLYGNQILQSQVGKDLYYNLNDIAEFVTSNDYIDGVEKNYWAHKLPEFNKVYKQNLLNLKDIGLPSKKHEQFNFSNLHKLYNLEILNTTKNDNVDYE